jgi:hypothetical protein
MAAEKEADTEALVRFLVTSLVENPESAKIEVRHDGSMTIYEVSLAPEDVGKIIGRKGRIIKAIRTVVRAAGGAGGDHVDVEVLG